MVSQVYASGKETQPLPIAGDKDITAQSWVGGSLEEGARFHQYSRLRIRQRAYSGLGSIGVGWWVSWTD